MFGFDETLQGSLDHLLKVEVAAGHWHDVRSLLLAAVQESLGFLLLRVASPLFPVAAVALIWHDLLVLREGIDLVLLSLSLHPEHALGEVPHLKFI